MLRWTDPKTGRSQLPICSDPKTTPLSGTFMLKTLNRTKIKGKRPEPQMFHVFAKYPQTTMQECLDLPQTPRRRNEKFPKNSIPKSGPPARGCKWAQEKRTWFVFPLQPCRHLLYAFRNRCHRMLVVSKDGVGNVFFSQCNRHSSALFWFYMQKKLFRLEFQRDPNHHRKTWASGQPWPKPLICPCCYSTLVDAFLTESWKNLWNGDWCRMIRRHSCIACGVSRYSEKTPQDVSYQANHFPTKNQWVSFKNPYPSSKIPTFSPLKNFIFLSPAFYRWVPPNRNKQ